jgi:hypothetical protein
MGDRPNTEARRKNDAEPLGEFTALGGKDKVQKTGERSRKAAGPDGPDATEVGDTFKRSPGKH